jgi:hypothetical protein
VRPWTNVIPESEELAVPTTTITDTNVCTLDSQHHSSEIRRSSSVQRSLGTSQRTAFGKPTNFTGTMAYVATLHKPGKVYDAIVTDFLEPDIPNLILMFRYPFPPAHHYCIN